MSFGNILQAILDGSPGALGIALMGNDGVAIEQLQSEKGRAAGEDIGTAGVEFGRILSEIRKASDTLGGGPLAETVISLARFSLIFRVVDDEFFLVLSLSPDGNLGKARYLIRRHLLLIRQEL
ncbi:MAG: hypothetical protein V3T33_06325 [Myxococcota bacterium]